MTIGEIYKLSIQRGIEADPRSVTRIKKVLEIEKKKFNNLTQEEKKFFDQDRLTNPYSDTRILYGDNKKTVNRILAGIDIGVSELLLADWLGDKGKKIDLVISHHPVGRALASLHDVIDLQADLLSDYGVPINVAESLLEPCIGEVGRKLSPGNHNREVDAAKILDIALISTHTVCDNLVYDFLRKLIEKKSPETVGELTKLISEIPEYSQAVINGSGPKIFAGKPARRCGKIAVTEITGGTSGSKHIYEKLSQAGVGTIVGMHMDEDHKDEAEKHHLNVIIAGHMASDSLGMNLFLDELVKNNIDIVPCSGLIRIKRLNIKEIPNANKK